MPLNLSLLSQRPSSLSLVWGLQLLGSFIPDPRNGPFNLQFVPDFAKVPGSPVGMQLNFIKQQFAGPPCLKTQVLMTACSVCVRSKSPHQPSTDLLRRDYYLRCPLFIKHGNHEHIHSDDNVFSGNLGSVSCPRHLQKLDRSSSWTTAAPHTDILTIVDRTRLCTLSLLNYPLLYRLMTSYCFAFSGSMVSDGGPRFSSQVWKALCQALSTSLTSGYHPQTNCQTEQDQSGPGIRLVLTLRLPSLILELTSSLDQICTQLPHQLSHSFIPIYGL